MSFLDRLLGREQERPAYGTFDRPAARRSNPVPDTDEAAVERYRYLLRTAPPESIEQAHAEAFAQLTPQQRREVLTQLGSEVPASERAISDDPQALARMATRAEMRSPGTLERSFGGRGMGGLGGGGIGMGGLIAGGLLASVAGAFVGTAIADAMFDASDGSDGADGSDTSDGSGSGDAEAGGSGDTSTEAAGYDGGSGSEAGGFDAGGFDGGGFDGGGFGDF